METVTLNNQQKPWLIGFSINPDTVSPELYTLFFPGEVDKPLLSENYLIFFNTPELATKAFALSDNAKQNFELPSSEVDLVCDIAQSLYLISEADVDSSATILNCLNILLDLVKAIKLPMPPEYQTVLHAFADYLTFSRELSIFFATSSISRSAITNAFIWCIGAVVSKSKLVK